MKNQIPKWETSEFGLPTNAGVYVVLGCNIETNKKDVLYIGSSKNIRSRVLSTNHPYRKLYDSSIYPYLIYTKSKVCKNYLELEVALIRKIQPKYNSNFKTIL